MKRVGIVLLSAVALLVIFTLALAQLETRSAKYLLRVMTGTEPRAYYGTEVLGPFAFTDGKPLFAVSATGEVDGPIRTGKVFLYDDLLAEQPVLTLTGPVEGELFGWTLSAGDWNGDSKPDLAVGAPSSVTSGGSAGKVYLYFGGSDFGHISPASITAGEKGDGFGEAICLSGDVNGDGLADLIIGAPRSKKAGATAGRAYVWFGKSGGTPGSSPDIEIKAGTTNDLFGSCIAVGDLTGDGQADAAIGAPHDKTDESKWLGAAFIYHGGKDISFANPSQIVHGEGTAFQDEFGESVAIIPDVNGDKAGELVVGAPQVTEGSKQVGKVYIFNGGAKIGPQSNLAFSGADEAGRFGQKVFSLTDINGDGKGDWAAQAESEAAARGAVKLFYGGWDKEFYRFIGENIGDRLGGSLAVLGDLDNNGSADILVGARWNDAEGENAGRVYLLGIEK